MEIIERSDLSEAVPETPRAFATFPAFVVLADGTLLASYSIGSGKDTDDLTIELRRSTDGGRTWTDPETPVEAYLDGRSGSLKAAPITRLDGDHLIVAGLWIDREAFPGQPLFNPVTEGCLPMAVMLADHTNAPAPERFPLFLRFARFLRFAKYLESAGYLLPPIEPPAGASCGIVQPK